MHMKNTFHEEIKTNFNQSCYRQNYVSILSIENIVWQDHCHMKREQKVQQPNYLGKNIKQMSEEVY